VNFENLFLTQRTLKSRCHYHFADLALVGHLATDQQILDDLLGDGRATLWPPVLAKIADEGADDAMLIDAMVLKEAPILGGDECLPRDQEYRRVEPKCAGCPGGTPRLLVIQYCAHAGELPAFQLQGIRKFSRSVIEELDDLAKINHRIGDVPILAFAELVVGG